MFTFQVAYPLRGLWVWLSTVIHAWIRGIAQSSDELVTENCSQNSACFGSFRSAKTKAGLQTVNLVQWLRTNLMPEIFFDRLTLVGLGRTDRQNTAGNIESDAWSPVSC